MGHIIKKVAIISGNIEIERQILRQFTWNYNKNVKTMENKISRFWNKSKFWDYEIKITGYNGKNLI